MAKDTGVFSMPQPDGSFTTYGVKVYDSYAEMQSDTPPHIQLGLIKGANTVYRFENGVWVIGFPQVNDSRECTAFEVYAHDTDIPVGECEELGGYVNVAIPACMSHRFIIRSEEPQNSHDVIVDWGDGNTTSLKDVTPNGSAGNYQYDISHTYQRNGKYTIKIFGRMYFALQQTPINNSTYPNILCRALESDLPVASHLRNFSSFCRYAKHLLRVKSFNSKVNNQYTNIAAMFLGCSNLLAVSGLSAANKNLTAYNQLFYQCSSLQTVSFNITTSGTGCVQLFEDCTSAAINVEEVFRYFNPPKGLTINVKQLFMNCSNLTGIVPADKLWKNTDITWTNTDMVFTGCSDEIRAQVPVSWGGTMEEASTEA